MKLKKYRKIKKTDKLPELPKDWKPKFILKIGDYDYIFAEGEMLNYTIRWDRVSQFPNEIFSQRKTNQ